MTQCCGSEELRAHGTASDNPHAMSLTVLAERQQQLRAPGLHLVVTVTASHAQAHCLAGALLSQLGGVCRAEGGECGEPAVVRVEIEQ